MNRSYHTLRAYRSRYVLAIVMASSLFIFGLQAFKTLFAQAADYSSTTGTYVYSATSTTTYDQTTANNLYQTTDIYPSKASMIPAAPEGVVLSSSCYSVGLKWPAVNGAKYYRIVRDGVSQTTSLPSYREDGLRSGSRYAYTIYAVNDYGASGGKTVEALVSTSCIATSTVIKPNIQSYPVAPILRTYVQPTSNVTDRISKYVASTTSRETRTIWPDSAAAPSYRISTSSYPYARATSTRITNEVMVRSLNEIQEIDAALENSRKIKERTIKSLSDIIDGDIERAVNGTEISTSSPELRKIRSRLINAIEASLENSPIAATSTIKSDALDLEIKKGLDEINSIVNSRKPDVATTSADTSGVDKTLRDYAEKIKAENDIIENTGGDRLYKDTNKDGISDFDSVFVYGIDPIKPSPKTVYGGREITAGEKILLGYDPTKDEMVKVVPEEPEAVRAPILSALKVEEVKLNEEKKVVLRGKALPNSYVTLYIYSTPIMVTVKADARGEWHYVVDKELDSGEHAIYTATVNNTGKILAKSNEYRFTKTAEAATLNSASAVQTSGIEKPHLFKYVNIYFLISAGLFIIAGTLVLVGIRSGRPDEIEAPNLPQGH